jgi:serine/threonine protein kinase
VFCDAAAEAKSRTEPLKDAVKDHEELLKKVGIAEQELKERKVELHEELLREVGIVEQELKKRKLELLNAKRAVEDVQYQEFKAQEAAARMQEAEVEVEARRRKLQECMRSYRQNLAEIFRLSSSFFPELSLVVKGREQMSHLATFVFTYDPQVAALLAKGREFDHYSKRTYLSRTPESRHDVYRASFDGQEVVLKKYNVKNDDTLKTLCMELVVLSQLKHPNIVPVNLFIEDIEKEGAVYIEFPLYDSDMEVWLKTSPCYPDVHASLHDVLRAIEHMHRARVVHCDIRPKNILMKQRVGLSGAEGATGKWQATLADFDVSLNSGARATIWQTRTEGPRGFEGVLTMAPELRAPLLHGCTSASDMYSFGGLLYVALYPEISPAMVRTLKNGEIDVAAHNNVDVAPLVRKLLQKDSKARPSANGALAYPLFAAAGANFLAQVQEQQREFERLQEEHRQKEERANQELVQKSIEVREEQRKLEEEAERLQRNSRQQQETERRLLTQIESLRLEKNKLREDRKREEREQRKRKQTLDEKEQSLRLERQKLAKEFPASPEHWTSANPSAGSTGKLSLVQVRETGVMEILQELLNGTGVGAGGRDQQQSGLYSRLELAMAWRVENHDLYCAYKVEQRKVLSFAAKVPVSGDSKARIRNDLYRSASRLPGDLEKGCNEVRLLHGTKPNSVWQIVQNGVNERFAKAVRFGDGSYFADDAGKIDHYVVEDQRYDAANTLHQHLYSGSSSHPGSVFYAFVFRVTLGHSVKYAKIGGQEPCFNPDARRRELTNIPNTQTPYHSLVAANIYRYNEYVIFHSVQTYPEYLLAFHRR